MAFKCIIAFTFVTIASAGLLPLHTPIHEQPEEQHHYQHQQPAAVYQHAGTVYQHNAPVYQHATPVQHVAAAPQHVLVHQKQHHHEQEPQYPNDPHPQYNFAYDVQDAISGDSKSQSESRDGDVVHGEYSLNDADGFRRTVKYTADDVNGFNAVVHREPIAHKVVATAAAPVIHYQHAPTYATLAAHREHQQHQQQQQQPQHHQHARYTTYELPQQHAHETYHQHH